MYRVMGVGIREVIMPMVNPLNSPNANEVLRRDKILRQETLGRQSGYASEHSQRPNRTKNLLRTLAKLIGGRTDG